MEEGVGVLWGGGGGSVYRPGSSILLLLHGSIWNNLLCYVQLCSCYQPYFVHVCKYSLRVRITIYTYILRNILKYTIVGLHIISIFLYFYMCM